MAKQSILVILLSGLLISCGGKSNAPPTSPPSVITATAKAAQTATAEMLPTSTPIPTDSPLPTAVISSPTEMLPTSTSIATNSPIPTVVISSPTLVVVTKSAVIPPTSTPIPNPDGTQAPEDLLQQAELNLITSQSIQTERTFELRVPGLTQTISSTCELVMPADIYCVSMTESRFTESADNAQSYQVELWQSADNAFVRQEAGAWQEVMDSNFMLDEVNGLLHMGDLTAVNSITETTLNDTAVYEINYLMEPFAFLEKFSGEQASDLLRDAQDINLRAIAWITTDGTILLQQQVILEFLKENSWVHVENNVQFSNHNQLTDLSTSAP